MDGKQVPQELVTEVGITFEQILEEVFVPHIHLLLFFFLLSTFILLLHHIMLLVSLCSTLSLN